MAPDKRRVAVPRAGKLAPYRSRGEACSDLPPAQASGGTEAVGGVTDDELDALDRIDRVGGWRSSAAGSG